MLSDGHLRRNGSNYRLEFTFKSSTLKFIEWLKFEILSKFCTKTPPTPYPKGAPTQYWFSTRISPLFTLLHRVWYKYDSDNLKNTRVVPQSLEDTLTGITLAYWIMGDGYWENDSQTIFLCTESFTEAEVDFLIKVLYKRLGLVATKKKRGDNYRIRFSSAGDNLDKLKTLTLDHMYPIMRYKLGL